MSIPAAAMDVCEFFHFDRAAGRCEVVPSAVVVDDHNRRRLACAPMAEFIIHAKGKCSKCRKPIVWCWQVNELP